jgi:tetratricopeptide (TPR) repeat protein
VAVNAENSYDFEKAVQNYQKLVKDYPASKNREAALFNSARLLEGQQRYSDAAAAFLHYAELFPQSEDTPKNIYRAALIDEKQGDWKGYIHALDEFIKKYSGKPAQFELVIDARKRVGDGWKKLGNERESKVAYQVAANEFDRRNLKPDDAPIAADAAAQARFQLAELEFKEFERLRIGGRGKALERSFAAKRAAVKKINDAYALVFKYKRLEWTLAALYRRGYALERFASTIIETPVPPDVKRLGEEAVIAYQDLLAQQTATLEDAAVESYSATLAEARKNHISNPWTKMTLESLNRFRPKEYPVLKDRRPPSLPSRSIQKGWSAASKDRSGSRRRKLSGARANEDGGTLQEIDCPARAEVPSACVARRLRDRAEEASGGPIEQRGNSGGTIDRGWRAVLPGEFRLEKPPGSRRARACARLRASRRLQRRGDRAQAARRSQPRARLRVDKSWRRL